MPVDTDSISLETDGPWDPPAVLAGCSKRLTCVLASIADADNKLEGAVLATLPPSSIYVLEEDGYLLGGRLTDSGRDAVEAAARYVNEVTTPVAVSALVDDLRAKVDMLAEQLHVASATGPPGAANPPSSRRREQLELQRGSSGT